MYAPFYGPASKGGFLSGKGLDKCGGLGIVVELFAVCVGLVDHVLGIGIDDYDNRSRLLCSSLEYFISKSSSSLE